MNRTTTPLVYVAGPYRAPTVYGISCNIDRAKRAAAGLWALGVAALCPHANSGYLDGLAPDQVFLAGALEMMRRCDAVLLVPGWEDSVGTRAELAEAERLGIPVYRDPAHLVVELRSSREWVA